jgi:anti-sigma factor RsiW
MKPECDRFVPLILRSADGALAPEARTELDAHVASCADCRAALGEQLAIRRLVKEIVLPAASSGFAARVRERVSPQPGVLDLVNWRAWALRLAPAAALIALLAWYPSSTTTSGRTATSQTLPAVVDEWAGRHAQIADGVLISASSDRDALLAAALGETSR